MTEKITHDLVQGTPQWDAFRLQHFGASEAAAMLGLSKKVTRPQLLQAKKTGIAREFSDWLQANVLDYGHEVEALARPLVEAKIGDELYPVTCSRGKLSASCDGITLDDRIAFEHKQWNEGLAAMVATGIVPDEHMPQCQQIMLVTGAEKVIFTVSDGTPEKMVYTEVLPDQAWFDRLVRGWAQFEADLETFEPPTAVAPAPTGRAPESLPALLVQVTGAVTASNLAEFKEIALSAIRNVNRELTTDQHFADAAKAVKWCSDVEERIDAAKEHALSQTASIDALFKVMDDIKAEARQTRLDLDKLVKARNVALKTEIVTAAQQALAKHIAALNERLGRPYMPTVPADFAGAIHGKKSFDSMRAALDATLANAKIFANEVADKIEANLKYLREHAKDHTALFPDTAQIVLKAPEDLQALATSRIAQHKAAEQKRLDDERERIRAEEQARADREARDRLAAEQAAQQATQAPAPTPAPAPVAAPAPRPTPSEMLASSPGSAANVVPLTRPAAPPVDTGARVKLGDITASIAPLTITAEGLATLGFPHVGTEKAAKLYRAADLPAIYAAMVAHIEAVQAKQSA